MASSILFTQFMLPHGKTQDLIIHVPDDVGLKAKHIREAGFRFECEQLRTGDCSYTITDDEADRNIKLMFAHELSEGRQQEVLRDLIIGFDIEKVKKEKEEEESLQAERVSDEIANGGTYDR
jgi:hypothetical protein